MEDPNTAAIGNAIAAGSAFWGRVQAAKENKLRQQQMTLEQQKLSSDLDTAKVSRELIRQQIAAANLAQRQAQKAEFFQSFNPVPGAKTRQSQKYTEQMQAGATTPASTGPQDVWSPEGASKLGEDWVQFPFPKTQEEATRLGIPFAQNNPAVWRMPKSEFDKRVTSAAALPPENIEGKLFDELSPEAQQHIVAEYQANAPEGVVISPAEAAQAYRAQQRAEQPPIMPGDVGLIPQSGEYTTPSGVKINLTAPVGGATGEGALTPEQFKDFGQPLQELLSKNEELKLAMVKAGHVKNVISYADEVHPTVSSDKSLIMSYLKTIDPSVRVSEGTVTTVMDQMGIPEEIKNYANKVLHGSLFTPEHRAWFKQAAAQNLENARSTAASSIQSSLGIASATGNPLASKLKLPVSVLPPSQGQRGHKGDGTVPGTSGGDVTQTGVRKFSSLAQAEAANLPPGTVVQIFDPLSGKYRKAQAQ